MTRIVAGLAKGRRLAVPGIGTRPTSDRAREALFNSLAGAAGLNGGRVLDLYAGTGAVGLEALSRGADEAVLVDSSRSAGEVLRKNVASVGLPGARVVVAPVTSFLAGESGDGFDVVFMDPPYEVDNSSVNEVLAALDERWLAPDAVVVVERSVRSGACGYHSGTLTFDRERRYGDTVLWYGRWQ